MAVAVGVCLVGCEKAGESSPGVPVVLTNFVERVREVVVTNVVNVAVTNVVTLAREPERLLSARKTASYLVASSSLDGILLRKLLAESGVRVIRCENGAVAWVEATDAAVGALTGIAMVRAVTPEEKVAPDVGEQVRIVPLSSIDVATVATAVRAVGGSLVQVVAIGRPCVRARVSRSAICKLAARGDVWRIERDDQ